MKIRFPTECRQFRRRTSRGFKRYKRDKIRSFENISKLDDTTNSLLECTSSLDFFVNLQSSFYIPFSSPVMFVCNED